MARRLPARYETEIVDLDPRGSGVGVAPDGRPVLVRPAAPGTRLQVRAAGRAKGSWVAQREHLVRPAADGVVPRCEVFGACGGCTLQELSVDAQRRRKQALALRAVGASDARVHPVRAAGAWGYRNKIELSFGALRYLSDEEQAAGADRTGRFLGFHAPGRFDRIVDTTRCHLVSDDANRLLTTVRDVALSRFAPMPRNARTKEGFWRHLLIREAPTSGQWLVTVFTTSPPPDADAAVARLAEALFSTPLSTGALVGFEWAVDDGLADVARGETRRIWGQPWIEERLGAISLRLGRQSFFQTHTAGALVLFDAIGEALGAGGTLLDLYCGAGTIGLYLADRFDQVVGVEVIPEAAAEARSAAARHGIPGAWHTGALEDVLHVLDGAPAPLRVVVDPPRVGLHPRAAEALAVLPADVLVYVACHPPSLGRDRATLEAGGWRMTDLWTVDLFPQTHHTEVVARFVREAT